MAGSSLRTNYRWWICWLLFVATTINYVDRQTIALLKPDLAKQFHWTEDDYGNIVFWFQCAYAAGYLFGGRLMDVIGLRRGFSVAVTLWSAAAVGTAFVTSVTGFCGVRAALGLAEGGNFPAAIKTVSEWFPRRERALATGLFNAGAPIGAIVTPAIVPFLTLHFGWRMAFIITGAFGAIWLIWWLAAYRRPAEHARCGAEELALIQADPPDPETHISWIGLLKYRATWAYVIGTAVTSPIWWFYLFWVPDFLFKKYHVDLQSVGPPLIAVYLISDVGSVGGGWLSSVLLGRGWSLTASRKTALGVCALFVVPVVAAAFSHQLWVAAVAIGLAAAGHQGWSANLFTLASDTMPRRLVSSVVGIGGVVGAVGGMFYAKLVPFVLDRTHSYFLLFAFAPLAYVVGWLAIHVLLPRIEPAVE
ncbi:MAG: MFS transporter [Fimbriimonadaceae bacterium]